MSVNLEEKKTLLTEQFDRVDSAIEQLELSVQQQDKRLDDVLSTGMMLTKNLLSAYANFDNKAVPESDDLLDVFKAFVKGEPSLNAVRDNVRELVYYQNCIVMNRHDALPKLPQRMVARTVRHIYLYLRTRCEQDDRLV